MKESPADPQENSGEFDAFCEKGEVKGLYFGHDHNNAFHGDIRGIDVGYTQGAGFHVYGPGLDRGVRTIALHRDGSLSTQDLRYRDLVAKSCKSRCILLSSKSCPPMCTTRYPEQLKFLPPWAVLP